MARRLTAAAAWARLAAALGGHPSAAPAGQPRAFGRIVLLPHQAEAAARLVAHLRADRVALLADATGLGKTYTACAVVAQLGLAPVLVVAPAAMRTSWEHALRDTGLTATVVSHEALSMGALVTDTPAVVVVDEAHHARNPHTRRWRALATRCRAAHVLCVSATPIHNAVRDLAALFALAWGDTAWHASPDRLLANVVRRTSAPGVALPEVASWTWHPQPGDPAIADAILALPAAVAPEDGADADALWRFGLVRAWASSGAALEAALRRRIARGMAIEQALAEGRPLTRAMLARWVTDDAVQGELALDAPVVSTRDTDALRQRVHAHVSAVRALRAVAAPDAADAHRVAVLCSIAAAQTPLLAFTGYEATAHMYWRALRREPGVALATGRGGHIASGAVPREEIFAALHRDATRTRPAHRQVRVLLATDVASEGLDLDAAACVVHLDLPWTPARVVQRIGRVVRLASRHRQVAVHAFAPPDASASVPLMATLAQKAESAARVGPDLLWDPAWHHAAPPSVPEATEALRIAALQRGKLAANAEASHAEANHNIAIAVLRATHDDVVAVMAHAAAPMLHTSDFVTVSRRLVDAEPWPRDLAWPRAAVRRAQRMAAQWTHRAHAASLAGTGTWSSTTGRALLRRAVRDARAAPRYLRAARARDVAALRARLEQPVAAGWQAHARALATSADDGDAWWAALRDWLHATLADTPAMPSGAEPRVLALFVLVAPESSG